jgi:hypothetical protein
MKIILAKLELAIRAVVANPKDYEPLIVLVGVPMFLLLGVLFYSLGPVVAGYAHIVRP